MSALPAPPTELRGHFLTQPLLVKLEALRIARDGHAIDAEEYDREVRLAIGLEPRKRPPLTGE